MQEETLSLPEYGPGPKDGTVDFDTFRVISEIRSNLPSPDFSYETITFTADHLHQGLIAVAITEMVGAFNDGRDPSVTVSKEAIAVLQAIGIPFERATKDENVIFAHDLFVPEQHDIELTGD